MSKTYTEPEHRLLSFFGWMVLLFILTWTVMSFHSYMIKRRLDRIEQQIQCR